MWEKVTPIILVAEDDDDDFMFLQEAFANLAWEVDLRRVENGLELLDHLCGRGKYANGNKVSLPHIILLDLNMPKKDGREALKEIKSDLALRFIPVIVLTTSGAKSDVVEIYESGGNAFVTKPENFLSVARSLRDFWFTIATLPKEVGALKTI